MFLFIVGLVLDGEWWRNKEDLVNLVCSTQRNGDFDRSTEPGTKDPPTKRVVCVKSVCPT